MAKAACECKYIDKVYISTDSDEICRTVENFSAPQHLFEKLKVVNSSAESAYETASTEFAMLKFADKYNFENIVLNTSNIADVIFCGFGQEGRKIF